MFILKLLDILYEAQTQTLFVSGHIIQGHSLLLFIKNRKENRRKYTCAYITHACILREPQTLDVAEKDRELLILLLVPSEC